ncbi:MAG: phosphate signaling complex protein PhoU [Methanothrix sp.]|jgi:phosphate transport system protein|uniref:Phosphate-specific transport system accessory protein PhoU n=1 Tax=Methanothrix harundinacea TaxID=301375 RepID=A0A117LFL7_9EURY|nr:MAG: Phosphate-specific transport system accessory protein PhoU [Methanothrix harundinacea]MDD2638654.1 phosphate signaling complex protein PhoU [Methanothrix sp.]MDI9400117.1 phosphate signaling complex protein PhoU [Euryarchaeota archaeon]KUK97596.1 MAG: Phosphate-specific transport system accessory protein PhoU [Methanothrix harundinacea]MCP1393580.1 phosphate signaling complex protein PhoU [Methanothrix harundinacea]
MSPYRERYRRELEVLKTDAEELVDQVDLAVAKSVEALREYDVTKARDVIRDDQIINDLSLRIEKRCMQLLALQQPMAKDLRLIVATLKIGIDLERIGDMAVDIARIVVHSKNKVHVKNLKNIPRMAEISREMLAQANKAFKENDADLARETTKWDYEVDALYQKVRDALLKIIGGNPDLIEDATPLLLVNKHLERIADHICNICESIIYMVEAKREHLN